MVDSETIYPGGRQEAEALFSGFHRRGASSTQRLQRHINGDNNVDSDETLRHGPQRGGIPPPLSTEAQSH